MLALPGTVHAVPALPSSFYGTVKLNSSNLPDGTRIQALINDQVIAFCLSQTYQGNSVYSLDIPGDDPGTPAVEGGREGDTIQFKVGGILASPTGVWHSATNIKLDLTASSTNTPIPPQPTATIRPTQTQIIIPSRTLPAITPPALTPTGLTATPIILNTLTLIQISATATSVPPTTARFTETKLPASSSTLPIEILSQTPSPIQPATDLPSNTSTSAINNWIAIPAAILFVAILIAGIWYFKKK